MEEQIYDAEIAVPGAGEATLKEITGAGQLSVLRLSEESLKSLSGEKLNKLFIRVYVDGGVRPSANVKLSDLVKLGGERPLNLTYSISVRFVLANNDSAAVTLKNLSITAC